MAAERIRPGLGGSSISPDLVEQRGFIVTRRGFDQGEVKAFLAQVAGELRAMRQREATLDQALGEAEERAAHPALDERTLMAAVGEETASILGSARAAAADIRAKAEDNAARILKEAHDRAAALRDEAEAVLSKRSAEAESVAAQVTAAATAEAERLRDAARQEATAVRGRAEADRKLMVDAAQGARDRIVGDLTRRRKIAIVQIEQLRAGRDRLLEAYKVVRRTLDEVTGELQRADSEARSAAEAAGRRRPVADLDDEGDAGVLAVAAPGGDTGGPGEGPEGPQAGAVNPAAGPTEEPSGPGEGSPGPGRGDVDLRQPPAAMPGGQADPMTVAGRRDPAGPTLVADERRPASVRSPRRQKEGREAPERPGEPPRPGVTESEQASVDLLFARIRADRADTIVEDRRVDAASEQPAVADPAGSSPVTGADPGEPTSDPDEAILQRRDEAVGDIESTLARRLKRVLQDEQNDLLDRLRGLGGPAGPDQVLPEPAAHTERFAAVALPVLGEAAQAGVAFAGSFGPTAVDRCDVDDLADDLAAAVVVPLRRRLEQALADGRDDDATLAGSVGAAYREWKTQRIEQAAADHVASAFARGAFVATPPGTRLRWLVEDVDGPCPDCDDNALAGGMPKGEAFPTGQQCPPAHAGCRCVLVPEAE